MNIEGKTVLAIGGFGLVGMAVCRELLPHRPGRIIIHSLRREEAEDARDRLAREAGETEIVAAWGDIFAQIGRDSMMERLNGQLVALTDDDLPTFVLHRLIDESRPDIVIDCVNTATGIAYRNIFRAAEKLLEELAGDAVSTQAAEELLDALYIPRLIRHIQVLYRSMASLGTSMYIKVGTTGTGGMGLNVPYTHSEEKPSRVLLSKSALAGAHSMLLFLMARTPGAPITKELKPAAAIAWKKIGYGPISRGGEPIRLVDARPRPLGRTFSTHDADAASPTDRVLESVFIDTGENGIFSLEEFSALTTSEQMEFVSPEEIARYLVFEVQGGNSGHDVINALDNVIIGPSYRAGLMRHWALEKMVELETQHGTESVAFEMLGPPRLSKLLYEAHLLRLAFSTMNAVRDTPVDEVTRALNALVLEKPEVASTIASVGLPVLLDSGEIIRGPKVIIPAEAEDVEITDERLEAWVRDGWVDLRMENCRRWVQRFARIHDDLAALDASETSSRYLRNHRFWHDENLILPGKIAGWIFAEEEQGGRMK